MKGKKVIIFVALAIVVLLILVLVIKFSGTAKPGALNPQKAKNQKLSSPKLMEGMTPIKWDDAGNVVETTSDDKDWYDYDNKKWANAKTEDGSMWVWIPRFAYMIDAANYHTETAGEISIKFLKDKTNKALDGTKNWDNVSGAGKWNIHPAFDFGGPIEGFWVAKFEASHSDSTASEEGTSETMKIQPGVLSWGDITVNDIFNNCKDYDTAKGSHMMKNSEWGAVLYLTQSKYGKNAEVTSNDGIVTGGGADTAYATANTEQSTTGNVTGIYDMSGGLYEYVAGHMKNESATTTTNYGKSLYEAEAKYKDVYLIDDTNYLADCYEANSGVYGDAVYETSSKDSGECAWYGCTSWSLSPSYPFFMRGGGYTDGNETDLFYFYGYGGQNDIDVGFRPVLVVK